MNSEQSDEVQVTAIQQVERAWLDDQSVQHLDFVSLDLL
jgi:hypothetical protein